MATTNDDFVLGLAKGKLGEVMDRLDRERPDLSPEDREAITVRLGRQEVAQALASRPDLMERFGDMAIEHFLRVVAKEMRSLRSP
jgi:hypothetical protein